MFDAVVHLLFNTLVWSLLSISEYRNRCEYSKFLEYLVRIFSIQSIAPVCFPYCISALPLLQCFDVAVLGRKKTAYFGPVDEVSWPHCDVLKKRSYFLKKENALSCHSLDFVCHVGDFMRNIHFIFSFMNFVMVIYILI